jgi:hypothetical protein
MVVDESLVHHQGGPKSMMTQEAVVAKSQELNQCVEELQEIITDAVENATPVHEIESRIWTTVLRIGYACLKIIFELLGTGDLGKSHMTKDGRTLRRLDGLRTRAYVSVFGIFELHRAVYAEREGKKIEYVPLDVRLALPDSRFSYLLQDWDQSFAVEQPYGQTAVTIQRILGITQYVDSLERMNHRMADDVEYFQMQLPAPPLQEEGAILVETADGKGVPLRRSPDAPVIEQHQTQMGPKPGRKKMAVLGSVYTIDPFVRTPEEVTEALFQRPDERPKNKGPARPRPCHKRVRACLNHTNAAGDEIEGMPAMFGWMSDELRERDPGVKKERVCVMDGQISLWSTRRLFQPEEQNVTEVLDLLHVTSRLWTAAHQFHKRNSDAAERFVRDRVLRILRGEVLGVVRGLRAMGTRRLRGKKQQEELEKICCYFQKNHKRMQYDQYLSRGYPIASGVIEGACRNVVKDRLERTGMSWRVPGAQSMLDLRCIHLSNQWEDFIQYRIQRETDRLYPHRKQMLEEQQFEWQLAT